MKGKETFLSAHALQYTSVCVRVCVCVCVATHEHIFMSISLSCVMLNYPPCTSNPIRIAQQANRGK